ncbi:MAG TPA: site-specific DNA-methyltransferase [Desulfobacterales bacterium]|nr:site-specific DNA-methyltransferase [Desulfobacterales bacterium]
MDEKDADHRVYTGKQNVYRDMALAMGDGKRRLSTVIREEWERTGYTNLGWRPTCTCFDHAFAPDESANLSDPHPICGECGQPHTKAAAVLDLAVGSGTTVQVARLLGRLGIGFDISAEYLRDQARKRAVSPAKIYCRPETPVLSWSRPLPTNEVIIGDVAEVLPHLPRASVDLAFLDPPFNLGKVYGQGVSDRLKEAYYRERLLFWLDLVIPLLKPTGSLVVHHIPLWAYRIAAHLESRGLEFRGWVAWQGKSDYRQPRPFRPEHYPFLWFSRGEECKYHKVLVPHARCARCGGYSADWGGKERYRNPDGRTASDVWTEVVRLHSAHKTRKANELPIEVLLRWVLALTDPGDYVLDPFLGSGTTAAACELSGRRWGGVELAADNLLAIRVKSLTARGARRVLGDEAVAASAEERATLGSEITRFWSQLVGKPSITADGDWEAKGQAWAEIYLRERQDVV